MSSKLNFVSFVPVANDTRNTKFSFFFILPIVKGIMWHQLNYIHGWFLGVAGSFSFLLILLCFLTEEMPRTLLALATIKARPEKYQIFFLVLTLLTHKSHTNICRELELLLQKRNRLLLPSWAWFLVADS